VDGSEKNTMHLVGFTGGRRAGFRAADQDEGKKRENKQNKIPLNAYDSTLPAGRSQARTRCASNFRGLRPLVLRRPFSAHIKPCLMQSSCGNTH
jgi:hypothetical protein